MNDSPTNLPTCLSFPKGIRVSCGTSFNRWLCFNLVGILGMAVQLATLAMLSRALPHHALCAAAIAVEITLLHNFTWHMRTTWRDRMGHSSRLQQLLRFHLSNGLISLLGNVVLTRLMIRHTHLPLLVANIFAILSCSVANFLVSHHWAFAQRTQQVWAARAVLL